MSYQFSDNGIRSQYLAGVKRIVVKVGSNVLRENPARNTAALIDQLQLLRQRGLEVILVTSGAIPLGMSILGKRVRPKELAKVQGLSAVGQCALMHHYENACEKHRTHCAQLLLTAADLRDRERNTHVAACMRGLLDEGILPIINENDSVTVAEIKIGDNDTLAAMVATMLGADLTVLMTTVDAFHEVDRDTGEYGRRFSVVTSPDADLLSMAGSTDGNQYSTGGMMTKLHAASICMADGHALAIIDGRDFANLGRLMAGDDIGTIFCNGGSKSHLRSWQRFLTFFSEPAGAIIIDDGAQEALCIHNKSLLPGGILGIRGAFRRGDPIQIVNTHGREVARGIVNFSSDELARICGAKSSQFAELLGHPVEQAEAVHKDYMVLIR